MWYPHGPYLLLTYSSSSLNNFYSKFEVNLSDVFDYSYLVNNKLLILSDDYLYIPEDKWAEVAKAIGISLGAGAAVGAAALGAHTVKKAKENNIYEDE